MTRIFLAVFLAIGFVHSDAQVVFPPAKTVSQTWVPCFESGHVSRELSNFRLRLAYDSSEDTSLDLGEKAAVPLPSGTHQLDLTCEHTPGNPMIVSATLDGKQHHEEKVSGSPGGKSFASDDEKLSTSGDFSVSVQFRSTGNGTLFAKCAPKGKWSPNAKALFIRGGRLVYDIGWVGALSGGPKVTDGKTRHVVLVVSDGKAELFLEGKRIGRKSEFSSPDDPGHVFKIAEGAANFTGKLEKGTVLNLRFWNRALTGEERGQLVRGELDQVNTPDLNFQSESPVATFPELGSFPGLPVKLSLPESVKINSARVQPLELADHRTLIENWNKQSLSTGKQIYEMLCVTCHGTPEKEGSLPTALKFHEGEFKNGSDPYRMYQTLEKGFGMMVPQPQYSAEQKYAVIHYIRETFLKPHNPKTYLSVDPDYIDDLPRPLTTVKEAVPTIDPNEARPYQKMDFGPALFWTYQVDRERDILKANIAQKGIAIRLDKGSGGVSKGKAWMVYDEDTMRVATAYTGEFVDWKGIAFDGSHGTHTSTGGSPYLLTPNRPAWKNPKNGSWDDTRIVGRDGRKFGPLPRDWVHYKGMYIHGEDAAVQYTVGSVSILEKPGLISYGTTPVFVRVLNIGESSHDLVTNLAPSDSGVTISLKAPPGVSLRRDGAGTILSIPAASTPLSLSIGISKADQLSVDGLTPAPVDLAHFARGGPSRFEQKVIRTRGVPGMEENGFAVDTLTVPNKELNPWNSWMRLGGFDFFPENPDRAAVCTWMGDVWLVDGVAGDLEELKWRRICSGLFQPLGLKIVDGKIYVTCRDQIARLHDLNGDEEIDYIENFNNDHQVTEHFHEFAMGLQSDEKGNFYYAKSARHALKAVVPHHGTLLRVSPDGRNTDIVATGFRAANGVCVNPDGTWIVTDQEGHWNPKNRINYVKEGGFYGNMFGYHDVTDDSDSAMEQPLCWITNSFDRSPAELLWVPRDARWGSLNGVLLNLSYGYGNIYTVPHEIVDGQAQGGMCRLPIESLPTGIHRGRFHPENRQLYGVGMFAWAGSQKEDGGFFRIRATGKPSWVPTKIEARPGKVTITFSDELPPGGSFEVRTWDLKRTAGYGSKHYNEKELDVAGAEVSENEVNLRIPDLAPTWGMEIKCRLGNGQERVIHNSIHQLPDP